jgi:small-conductance mechanosensitive channel
MKAKFYTTPGPAKAQVTFWAKHYPEMGIPFLVRITLGKIEHIEQKERVVKVLDEQAKIEKRNKLMSAERELAKIEKEMSLLTSAENQYSKKIMEIKKTIENLKK